MSRHSHVSLIIGGKHADSNVITAYLNLPPSRILNEDWCLDSPLGDQAQVIDRLLALTDLIEPHADRLRSLDPKYAWWIDILYHATPDFPLGVDWIVLPSTLMSRLGALELNLSYEVMWFWDKQSAPQDNRRPISSAGGAASL